MASATAQIAKRCAFRAIYFPRWIAQKKERGAVESEWVRRSEGDRNAPVETKGFVFNQAMIRVKDPAISLAFYQHVLGMTLVKEIPFPASKFTLYFLGYVDESVVLPADAEGRVLHAFSNPAMLELTHNWGTEVEEGPVYHNGNADPRGFGHIGIAVPDVVAACDRFERLGVEFVKRPEDGTMKGLAFIRDPDGYWIEILAPQHMPGLIKS